MSGQVRPRRPNPATAFTQLTIRFQHLLFWSTKSTFQSRIATESPHVVRPAYGDDTCSNHPSGRQDSVHVLVHVRLRRYFVKGRGNPLQAAGESFARTSDVYRRGDSLRIKSGVEGFVFSVIVAQNPELYDFDVFVVVEERVSSVRR